MSLRTLIVEDEILARKSMERLTNKNPELELVGICTNGQEGVDFLKENHADLILLDVEMPEMDGFEFLEEIDLSPYVIITTTKEEHAYNAFRYQVDGYLKKPITIPQFNAEINKLIQSISESSEAASVPNKEVDDIYLKVDNRLIRVTFSDIQYVENVGDYVKVVTQQDSLIIHTTMKGIEEKLPKGDFLRVHRSYIVNLRYIRDIEQNSIVLGGNVIPVSRAAKPELMARLNTL